MHIEPLNTQQTPLATGKYDGVPCHPLFGYHIAQNRDGFHVDPTVIGWCFECGQRWPCDTAERDGDNAQLAAIAARAQAVSEAFLGVPGIPIRAYLALSRLDETLIAYDPAWAATRRDGFAPRQPHRPQHAGDAAIRALIRAVLDWHDTPDGSGAERLAEINIGATVNGYRADLERLYADATR